MNMLRKIAGVYANEGMDGLVRRIAQRTVRRADSANSTTSSRDKEAMQEAKRAYEKAKTLFGDRCQQLGHSGIDDFYWYHTVDLKDGLVTPGDYDFRESIQSFGFPEDMRGMKVLDVGSATGYFAFEFERRGAQVTSVELPSFAEWDVLAVDRAKLDREMLMYFNASTQEEAYTKHLDGPFRFCHSALRSEVKRTYSSIYNLSPTVLGEPAFDLVYAGDILIHLFSPLRALDVLSSLCRGSLYLTMEAPFSGSVDSPLVLFQGGSEAGDSRSWWQLGPMAVNQMLRRVGFAKSSTVGAYSGVIRRQWTTFDRQVVRADKAS